MKESSQVTGEAWATELGFKPGPNGFAGFATEDVERLAKLAGFRPAGTEPIPECLQLAAKLPAP